jgi:hypothetical protein
VALPRSSTPLVKLNSNSTRGVAEVPVLSGDTKTHPTGYILNKSKFRKGRGGSGRGPQAKCVVVQSVGFEVK